MENFWRSPPPLLPAYSQRSQKPLRTAPPLARVFHGHEPYRGGAHCLIGNPSYARNWALLRRILENAKKSSRSSRSNSKPLTRTNWRKAPTNLKPFAAASRNFAIGKSCTLTSFSLLTARNSQFGSSAAFLLRAALL